MNKEIKIPEGYEARIEGNKVVFISKESEDERIRKALIKGVCQIRCKEGDITQEQMIAWLEKQKEEEGYEAIPVESTLEYKLGFKAGKESEKQKEQKSAEWSEEDERKYQCIRNILLTDADKKVGSWKYSEILEWYEKKVLVYTKSKTHWKPSEDQLLQLRCAISGCSYDIEPLVSLEEQLKNL